jgi:hypothetical protein
MRYALLMALTVPVLVSGENGQTKPKMQLRQAEPLLIHMQLLRRSMLH